ncbi:MAG TPA: hypothetical protein VN381_04880 [Anaerovoracaceae bacterium]|nr:hypothetical protein [Anaerovoracaceae bacterium]
MEQVNLAALVTLIMADKRIQDLIRNGTNGCHDLTLIETEDIFDTLPFEWRENVYCQEQPIDKERFLSFDAAVRGEWNTVRIYQPSLNVVAKLALGVADEPLLFIVQQMITEGAENIELLRLCNLSRIKAESYKKLFLGYIDKIKSYGIKVSDDGVNTAEGDFPTAVKTRKAYEEKTNAVAWQYRALTERDLLDMEKGSVVTVGRRCIVTSLAVDAARRKEIQICREGEGR